ncbi:MAG TPA: phosphatidylglycerophosphatase A, partial [Acidovorax sp.]|nr:phosphatidylglycerophosphatase A [Acidovorax sp.]
MTVSEPPQPLPSRRPTVAFMFSHPAHFIALGFGAGLSRVAPGTVGTLWA